MSKFAFSNIVMLTRVTLGAYIDIITLVNCCFGVAFWSAGKHHCEQRGNGKIMKFFHICSFFQRYTFFSNEQ